MFDGILQPTHLILILAIVLIIFGPGKLPDLGRTLGNGIREFRDSVSNITSEPAQPVAPAAVAPSSDIPAAPVEHAERS